MISKMDQIDKSAKQIKGLPKNPKLANIKWSPDQTKIVTTNTKEEGVELWYIDLKKLTAKKLTGPKLNASLGDVITWYQDSKNILTKFKLKNSPDIIDGEDVVPTGPIISSNDGKKAQNRTYQDLLKNEVDEKNFETLARSVLSKVSLKGKTKLLAKKICTMKLIFTRWKIYFDFNNLKTIFIPSPLLSVPHKICYLSHLKEKSFTVLREVPVIADLPKGFMAVRTGPRNFHG